MSDAANNPTSILDDLNQKIWPGIVLSALQHLYTKESATGVKVQRKPSEAVFATKDYAVGAFKLVAFSRQINCVAKKEGKLELAARQIDLGYKFTNDDGADVHIVLKPDTVYEREGVDAARANKPPRKFIVPYWVCMQTHDTMLTNCEKQTKSVKLKVGVIDANIELPICTNFKPIKAGDKIVVQMRANEVADEPAKGGKGTAAAKAKAGKGGKARGGKGGKAKGKGAKAARK